MKLLEARGLGVAYGDFQVLWDASIEADKGEIVCLLGPNGSGKSTLMNSLSRLTRLTAGEILFDGHALHDLPPHRISSLGLSHVLERHRLFPYMTVLENLLLGAGPRPDRARLARAFERVYSLFPRLKEREKQLAHSMSGGEQQMCAIARGLMSEPKLLMVDEPFIGLSPQLRHEVAGALRRLNEEGVTILLIEQNVREALAFAHRAYVLRAGRIVLAAPAGELLAGDALESVFFGRRDDERLH
ncbi:MAG: ABC transporter ATP-binding protein [Rhodospirillales bacterium]|nr:ABC transporter ATP-binding protein [Rhodospirillales bacterium]